METSEIVTTVLIPLFIGPLFIFFKTLWDRYNAKKDNVKKIEYDEQIGKIREQLNNFYWPVLIKLKCLNHLNYSEVKTEHIELKEIFLEDSMSEPSDIKPIKMENNRRKKRKKGKICGNNTMIEGDFVVCQNIVKKTDVYKMCQKCLRKKKNKVEFSDSDSEAYKSSDNLNRDDNLNLYTKIDIEGHLLNTEEKLLNTEEKLLNTEEKLLNTEEKLLNTEENLSWDEKDVDTKIRRRKTIKQNDIAENIELNENLTLTVDSPRKVKINIVDDTSGTSSSSKASSSSGSNIIGEDKLVKKTIKIEKLLKFELDNKIITLCVEIKNIIEGNIAIIKPDKKLGKELVKFIRFVETICIIANYNTKKKEMKNKKKYINYNYRDLGVIDNTKKLIKIISDKLNLLLIEEQDVKTNYLY